MKILIMCEGPNELEVVNILLENDRLTFTYDDLLNLMPYHARQISNSSVVRTALNLYCGDDIVIMRIGDSMTDALKIPREYAGRFVRVEKYCTKPEIEMLFIIAEDRFSEYDKVKSSTRPKVFAKEHIKCGRKRYDNSSQFYRDYFESDVDLLVNAIREYKRVKAGSHKRDEHCLADLLK